MTTVRTVCFHKIPEQLKGQPLEVRYISSLAQAQRAVATQSLDRTWVFASAIASLKPDVLDKINTDWVVEEYARVVGVSPKAILSDSEVKKIRDERAKQQAAVAQAEALDMTAGATKNLASAGKDASDADAGQ